MSYVGEYGLQIVTDMPLGLKRFTSSYSVASLLGLNSLECDFLMALVQNNYRRCTELVSGMNPQSYRRFLQNLASKGYVELYDRAKPFDIDVCVR